MTITAPATVLGMDWSDPEAPCLRLASQAHGGGSALVPVLGEHRFTVREEERWCVGWFDLTGPEPVHVVCGDSAVVMSGRQCGVCRRREGFTAVHQAHRGSVGLPANVRDYLAQPHWLYVDVFGHGALKVGTAAESRRRARLAEQGPVAAAYMARTRDGIGIRTVEAAVSERFALTQQVATRRKVTALQNPIDVSALTATLTQLAGHVGEYLRDIAPTQAGMEVLREPELWVRPACASAVFDAAPLFTYPHDLDRGSHHLRITAASGPVAVLTHSPDGPSQCADLTTLIGRRLTPATSDAPPASAATLF